VTAGLSLSHLKTVVIGKIETQSLVKLNLLFYMMSFIYFPLMHVGLWGKLGWDEGTKFRLLLMVGRKTRWRQQIETQPCALVPVKVMCSETCSRVA